MVVWCLRKCMYPITCFPFCIEFVDLQAVNFFLCINWLVYMCTTKRDENN
jgi:hypothetical protein